MQWLRAQLDEDERIARGTGQPGTSWQNLDMVGELRDDVNAGTVAYIPREETRAHIAEWDPVRVLREIDAKRQLIHRYERAMENRRAHPDDLASAGALLALHGAVKLLALPYADRPGYREEWRP
ncbi:DUF6221 family protein [Streptomyces cellulosae]